MTADDDDDRSHDPMAPEAWYQEPDVCGSCIAWRPEPPKPGDEVSTGVCRLRPELARVPASLKLCDLYKPRGQFVYVPKKDAGSTRRKRTSKATVLRRSDSGQMVAETPPPTKPTPFRAPTVRERPPEERYTPPKEIDLGQDAHLPGVRTCFRDAVREELGFSRREIAPKYKGGKIKVAIKEGPYVERSTDLLFSILDRLKSSLDGLEKALVSAGLESEVHNVKKVRGSLTTFNVIWADREDYFSGK